MKLPFNYIDGLYRLNNFGKPIVWYSRVYDEYTLEIFHGIIGGIIRTEIYSCKRLAIEELKSRINAKRKQGYKYLPELKDSLSLPVEGELYNYLLTYLPKDRTTADGILLPMLAKTYDNNTFNKVPLYFGQYKINGLRCFITAKKGTDLFNPIRLQFQSREGTIWTSLNNLEDYLLNVLDKQLLDKMLYENYALDGELYLPGYSINQINHIVKDANSMENHLLQFWCYDIAIENETQNSRLNTLYMYKSPTIFNTKGEHLGNVNRFIVLPKFDITYDILATMFRDKFINLGFEGLILRNPAAEYGFGKRAANVMIKYKKHDDGVFKVIAIYPEGEKRKNIPLLLCKNDINDATFEIHIGGNLEYQESVLKNKDKYIGKDVHIDFGERSGINKAPFHVKATYFL